jgi:acyl-CoA synthetase (AMP-forming)/AMP-acid ligase II
MRGQMMNQPLLISSQIEFAARYHSDVDVISRTVDGAIARTTWGEIAGRARKLANALTALGIGQGDRVATIAWNTHRHLEVYFAVSSMGAVLHTINPRLPLEQLRYIVDHAEDTALFFDTTFVKLAECLADGRSTIRHFVAMTDARNMPVNSGIPGLLEYEAFIGDRSDAFEWPQFDENTASSLCYTSGTIGHPKGVLYSHRSTVLHSYAISMPDALNFSARDAVLPVVPMFHVNAWGVPYAAAAVGAKVVLPGPKLDGASLVELIDGERVTCLLGVPTVWMGLLAYLREQGKTLTTVKKVVCGGSAAPSGMIQAFERDHGVQVLHAWGMTEMSPLGTVSVPLLKHAPLDEQSLLALKCKQGRPIFGVDIRIVGADGVVLPDDGKTSGHLQVRGNWIVDTYFKSADGPAHKDGWFDTGDIATIDQDCFMQITDRAKDVIKSGGEWISSIVLENAAMSHPSVALAAAIGVPHPKWVERPLLLVVKAPGRDVSAEELIQFLETKVVKWWLPDAIEFVDALPIGATGKVLKRELREKFAARPATESP